MIEKVCDVIINSGSTKNIVCKALVTTFGLNTNKHPNLYSIGWIRKGTIVKLKEICKMSFSIGKHYQGEIVCDVVEMDARHILVDMPWKHVVNVVHKGKQNVYPFDYKDKKIALIPVIYESPHFLRLSNKPKVLLSPSMNDFLHHNPKNHLMLTLIS